MEIIHWQQRAYFSNLFFSSTFSNSASTCPENVSSLQEPPLALSGSSHHLHCLLCAGSPHPQPRWSSRLDPRACYPLPPGGALSPEKLNICKLELIALPPNLPPKASDHPSRPPAPPPPPPPSSRLPQARGPIFQRAPSNPPQVPHPPPPWALAQALRPAGLASSKSFLPRLLPWGLSAFSPPSRLLAKLSFQNRHSWA